MGDTTRRITLYVNGTEVENSHKAITAAFKKEQAALSGMNRSAEDYEKQLEKVAKLKGMMDEHRKAINGVESSWSSMLKNVGQIASGFFIGGLLEKGVQAIGQFFPMMSQNAAKLSDEMADIAKTTGLTTDEVKELNKELKKIDTRTSMADRRALAVTAGKLGKNNIEDIRDFVEVSDKLLVALGEDLGGTAAIKELGKLNEIFGIEKQFGTGDGLLKTGSAINSLGAASVANEEYIVSFSKQFGGFAKDANISMENVMGLAAAMDILGKSEELASSAVGKLLVDMGQQKGLAKYAKVAKMEMADFSELIKTDANEALIKVLEGAKSTKGGLSALAETLEKLGVNGVEQARILPSLASNIELLRKQQGLANKAFKEGTSVVDEFNTKNETYGAKVDKLRNSFTELGNGIAMRLQPHMENFVDSLQKMIGISASKSIEMERDEVNQLAIQLADANISENKRLEILKKLKAISPEVVAGISNEKDALELLWKNLDIYNQKSFLREDMAENDERANDMNKFYKKFLKQKLEVEKDIRKWEAEILSEVGEKGAKLIQRIKSDNTMTQKKQLEMIGILSADGDQTDKIEDFLDRLETAKNLMAVYKGEIEGAAKANRKLQDELNKLSYHFDKKEAEAAMEAHSKQQEEKKQKEVEEKKKADKLKFELALENLKKEQDLREVEAQVYGATEERMTELRADHAKQRFQLYARYAKASTVEAKRELLMMQQLQQQLAPTLQKDMVALTGRQQKEVANTEEGQLTEVIKRHIQERIALYMQYGEAKLAASETDKLRDLEDAEFERHKGDVKKRWELRKKYELLPAIELLKYEKFMLRKKYEEDVELFAEGSEEKKRLYEAYLRAVAELENSYAPGNALLMSDADFEKFREKADQVLSVAGQISQVWGMAMQRSADSTNRELDNVDRVADEKTKRLDQQLKAGAISQRRYDAIVEKIEQERDERSAEIHRKQAEREKGLAIFNAIIDTASAVVAALSIPPPFGQIYAGIVGATGAAQVAMIAAQPIPEYAAGGWVNNDMLIRAGEKGKEWVASNTMVNDPVAGPIIQQLDAVQSGRASFASPNYSGMGEVLTQNSTTTVQNYYSSPTSTQEDNRALAAEMRMIRELLSDPNNRKASVDYYQLSRFEEEREQLYKLGRFG